MTSKLRTVAMFLIFDSFFTINVSDMTSKLCTVAKFLILESVYNKRAGYDVKTWRRCATLTS
jgi:hypothetical protein